MLATLTPAVSDTSTNTGAAVGAVFGVLVALVFAVLISGLVFMGTFKKAGEPGWAAFVPIYNQYVLTRIAGYNPWLFLLALIPLVNIVFSIMVALGVGKAFGKGGAFSFFLLWLFSLIGYLMLSYGSAQFIGRGGIAGDRPNAYA